MSIIETNKPIKKTRHEARFTAKHPVKEIDETNGTARMLVDDIEIGSGSNSAGRGNRRHANRSSRFEKRTHLLKATKLVNMGKTVVDIADEVDVPRTKKDVKSLGWRHVLEIREKPASAMDVAVATA